METRARSMNLRRCRVMLFLGLTLWAALLTSGRSAAGNPTLREIASIRLNESTGEIIDGYATEECLSLRAEGQFPSTLWWPYSVLSERTDINGNLAPGGAMESVLVALRLDVDGNWIALDAGVATMATVSREDGSALTSVPRTAYRGSEDISIRSVASTSSDTAEPRYLSASSDFSIGVVVGLPGTEQGAWLIEGTGDGSVKVSDRTPAGVTFGPDHTRDAIMWFDRTASGQSFEEVFRVFSSTGEQRFRIANKTGPGVRTVGVLPDATGQAALVVRTQPGIRDSYSTAVWSYAANSLVTGSLVLDRGWYNLNEARDRLLCVGRSGEFAATLYDLSDATDVREIWRVSIPGRMVVNGALVPGSDAAILETRTLSHPPGSRLSELTTVSASGEVAVTRHAYSEPSFSLYFAESDLLVTGAVMSANGQRRHNWTGPNVRIYRVEVEVD